MADEGATKMSSSGTEDTVPASDDQLGDAPQRSSLPQVPPPPEARYRLGQELGRGGMGRVVEAFDTHLQRTVALKEVLPKADVDRRFQREVRITARLEHASIVPLYDSGRYADGRPFYVMRRVSGRPLDEAIARAGSLENRLALLPNALAAIDAIAHAHKRGVLHRDLKPQNILVGELGETVVIDWGLAKVVGDSDDEPVHDSLEPKLPTAADSLQTQVGSVFGTPGFMAPEQARGDDLGPQGDVYALGATLYQLIVGRPPFGGTSATDVIVSTLRHRLEPVSKACPAAPPELVTIIEKALAFDPRDRYNNAGELAEDLRRFTTGQLVAAHRYTRRQRIARFARRHRAPLVVAALASVGIAALAWISVNRIVHERDYAEQQSMIAREQRKLADEKAADLRERADQLLLTHARGLLPTSPTQALAVLKQIEATEGRVLDEAKAIGRAAVTRGVAWGLPTLPEFAVSLEMTDDGKRVLQMSRNGALQIVDLEHNREQLRQQFPGSSNAYWVDHDRKVLITTGDHKVLLFDPVTRSIEQLQMSRPHWTSITDDGSRIAAVDDDRSVVLIDVATKLVTHLGHTADNVEIARDGSWIAIEQDAGRTKDKRRLSRLVVLDPTGKELARRESSVSIMGSGPNGKLAVTFEDGLYELSVTPQPTFTKIPFPLEDIYRVHRLLYRDDRLFVVGVRALYVWNGKELIRLRELPDGVLLVQPFGERMIAMTGGDGLITILDNGLEHSVSVTERPNGTLRIAAVPGSTKLVATSREALLVWDLATVFPTRVVNINQPVYATESMLVSVDVIGENWSWITFPAGTKTTAKMPTKAGLPRNIETQLDGRTLAVIERSQDRSTAVVAYPDGKQFVVEDIAFGIARLVPGDGLVFSPGKGRVFGKVGAEQARELVTLDGDVQSLEPLGTLGFVTLSKKGELVRGNFDGSNFARTKLSDGTTAVATGESDGTVLVASGNKLMRWTGGALEEIARTNGRITGLQSLPVGTVIWIAGGEALFMAATGDRTPHHMDINSRPEFAPFGSRVVSVNERSELEILELPSLALWTLPHLYTPGTLLNISPLGGHLYQTLGWDAALWTIPEPASDLGAWLDGLTNATETDNHLTWPFPPP